MIKAVLIVILVSLCLILIIGKSSVENWNPGVGGIHGAKSCNCDSDCRWYNGKFSYITEDTGKTCVMEHPNPGQVAYAAGRPDGRCVDNEVAKQYYDNNRRNCRLY